jgi:hypothetical protein
MISRPCQRCHRVRPIAYYPYCAGCAADLRAMEQRRPAASSSPESRRPLPPFVLPEMADEAPSE